VTGESPGGHLNASMTLPIFRLNSLSLCLYHAPFVVSLFFLVSYLLLSILQQLLPISPEVLSYPQHHPTHFLSHFIQDPTLALGILIPLAIKKRYAIADQYSTKS